MATSRVTFVTGTAEVKRRDPSGQQSPYPDQRLTTEQQVPFQVTFVDGKCTCCPYGYHIDLDFLNFCRDLESGSTLRNLKRIQRTKRKLRKSMEIMLDEQEGRATDQNSAPPDIVHSTEAGRLMHMINYERSATHHILSQIDSSVNTTIANIDGVRGHRYMSSDSDEPMTPFSPSYRAPYDGGMTPPLSQSARTDSLTSLSSASTMSSESHLMQQAQLYQQDQQFTVNHKITTSKVIETPVIEMATAEVKQYSTTSQAQLAPPTETVLAESTPKQALSLVSPKAAPIPPASPGVTPAVKEALALSAHRIKELEEQVKTIPILQVRISVLKEEKRLLNLQLKASKANSKPPVSSVGVGDGRVDVDEKVEKSVYSPRQFEFPKSFSPVTKTPPPTLPKPTRTSSVGVGEHAVTEPYLLQPDLPTGYTIRDNETHTELHTTTVIERERLLRGIIQPPSLNRSFQHTVSQESLERESRLTSTPQSTPEPRFTINQIQRGSPRALTRTIGIGDGNVYEDSGLHVHEKEMRTVIFGQNNAVATRNVGIDCRVATRDVGVSFMFDEEKPATRTIGVNVSYDTSGILTSFDFKGETELRMALRGVLQRSVHSVGTNCNFRISNVDATTSTESNLGVSVGCGDEDHTVDVEIRPSTVKKSIGLTAKPDCVPKCVSTEKDWVLDASTNTSMIDHYHKACMTDKQKLVLASTNTDPAPLRHSSVQTELNVFMNNSQIKHAGTNTDTPKVYSTAVLTDKILGIDSATNTNATQKYDVGVNTTEKVSELFSAAQKKPTELKSILKKPQQMDKGVGDDVADEDSYSFSEITEVVTPITIVASEVSQLDSQARSFVNQKESVSKSQQQTAGGQLTTYEVSRRSSGPSTLSSLQSEARTLGSLESGNSSSAFDRVSPTNSESFQETVTEHYIITKDGKRLVSEEKTTTSSKSSSAAGAAKKQVNGDSTTGHVSSSQVTIMQDNGHNDHREPKGILKTSKHSHSGGLKVDKNYLSLNTNPYRTLENLSEVSAILDSEMADRDSNTGHISKTSSEGNLYQERNAYHDDTTKSLDDIYDMRRTGSVEDFMPDDIKRYMSIESSVSKDSGFGEDLQGRFSGDVISGANTAVGGGMASVKLSKTITTRSTTKSGDKLVVQETKTVEGPDGKCVTTVTETSEDGNTIVRQYEDAHQGPHSDFLSAHAVISSDLYGGTAESGQLDSDSCMQTSTESDVTTSSGNYGSLDRTTGKLKSIMKHSHSETEKKDKKTGIRFADSVTGGTGTSSEEDEEEDDTSDSDSTTSFDEGSYDSQQGEVIYKCGDDEVMAQGLPGAQMFDQNIRETYELSDDIREACQVLATYLQDSTEVQTKQLTTSQTLVQQEWFKVSSMKLSSPHQVEDFLSSVNEISKSLLKFIVNMADVNGNTAIHYCISHCNFDIASLLLDSDVCDINRQNKAGYTPIMLAGLATIQNNGQLEVVRRIFSTGDINARAAETQQTALMLAASHGKTEMVRLLVEEGAEINLQDVDGSTALMCACEHGHLDIVNFLLSQPNIDAKITDNENSTALSIAMEAGHKDVGVILYKHLNFSKPSSPQFHGLVTTSPTSESTL